MKVDSIPGGRTTRAGSGFGAVMYREVMHHIIYPILGRRDLAAEPSSACGLTSPVRRALQPPEEVLDAAGVQPGMTVLEVGPGPGFFVIPAANRIGPTGRVIAVDVQQEMVDKLAEAVDRAGVSNVEMHVGDAVDLPVPDASVDVALMVTVLGEIPDQDRALAELRRVLKTGGALCISELLGDPHHQSRSAVTLKCEQAGFEVVDSGGNWLWHALKFRPNSASGDLLTDKNRKEN